MTTILTILAVYIILTLLPHAVGPRPRWREWPDPIVDWVFGVGVVLGAVVAAFQPTKS